MSALSRWRSSLDDGDGAVVGAAGLAAADGGGGGGDGATAAAAAAAAVAGDHGRESSARSRWDNGQLRRGTRCSRSTPRPSSSRGLGVLVLCSGGPCTFLGNSARALSCVRRVRIKCTYRRTRRAPHQIEAFRLISRGRSYLNSSPVVYVFLKSLLARNSVCPR